MSDPNFPKVSLLLHCEGSNGSATFTDSSSYGRAVTANGAAQITTSGPITGNASGLFDGSTAYLSVLSSADLDFGSGDFTIQIRYKPTALTTSTIIGRRLNSTVRGPFYLGALSSGAVRFLASSDGVNWTTNVSSAAGVLAVGVVAEITVSRVGSNLYVLVNGAVVISTTISGALTSSSSDLFIGGDSDALRSGGRFDEARIIKGIGRYAAAYTVTAGPFSDFAIDGSIPESAPALSSAGEPGFTVVTQATPESAPGLSVAGDPGARRQPIDATPESAPGMAAAGAPDAGAYYVITVDSAGSESAAGEIGASFVRDYPVTITITNGAVDVDYPVRIHLGEAATVDYPVRVTLFDAATQGGLNGAGGWAAAPDGRWQATVLIGGVDRSAELMGTISVRREHNAAALAEFDLRPVVPMAPLSLIGKPVRIAFAQRGPAQEVLNAQLMFRGVVEQPEYIPATRSLHLLCTDQFQEVMRNTPRGWFDAQIAGRFSAEVSGEPADNLAYALERLASVPKSLALNVEGAPTVIPWRDTSAVLRVTDADGVDGTPTVRLPSRSEMISRIEITAEYSYQVARNRGIVSQWQRPARWFINGPDNSGFPIDWLTTDMVEGALGSMDGWDLTSLTITHPTPGDYPQGIGVDAGVYTIRAEVAPDLAIGWNAKLATRWQQSRTEVYTLTVVAPNVEAMLGQPVSRDTGVSVTAPDLPDAWAADATVTPRFAAAMGAVDPDAIIAALIGDTNHVHEPEQDGKTAWDAFVNAATTLLDRARMDLWAASRTGRVEFRLPCRPDLWLDRRIEVDVPHFHAAGDVVGVTHTLDASSGTALTELTLAVGLPGDVGPAATAWALPNRPDPDAVLTPGGGAGLGGIAARHTYYVGGLGSSPEFNEATMIGFATNSTRNNLAPDVEKNALNWYPLQLTIEAPEVPESDRDPLDIPVAQDYAWNVPTDILEIA